MKYSIRSNININLTKTTELVLRMSGTFDEYTGPIGGGSFYVQGSDDGQSRIIQTLL